MSLKEEIEEKNLEEIITKNTDTIEMVSFEDAGWESSSNFFYDVKTNYNDMQDFISAMLHKLIEIEYLKGEFLEGFVKTGIFNDFTQDRYGKYLSKAKLKLEDPLLKDVSDYVRGVRIIDDWDKKFMIVETKKYFVSYTWDTTA